MVEMVKTIAKPIYNWMISTDNDPVMEKFTNCMLPETQFRGHHDEHKISSHAQQGDGATVWQAMSRNSLMWNLLPVDMRPINRMCLLLRSHS